jgi:hypothetical protein
LFFWRIIVDTIFAPEKLWGHFRGILMLFFAPSIHRRARGGNSACRFFFA